jgi:two-component system cell cycle sensor histidine kinase/response regulator CckA
LPNVAIVGLVALLALLAGLGWYLARLRRRAREADGARVFLQSVLNRIGDPVFVKDRQHRLVLVNDAECRLAGRSRAGLIGKTDYDFFPKEQVDVFWHQDDLVFATGQENINEEVITDADGVVRTIVTKKALYASPEGTPFIVGVIRDITDRKRAEEEIRKLNDDLEQRVVERTGELARAHRYLDEIIDSVADPIFVKDREHRWVLLNAAFCDFVGRERQELLGKSDYDLFPKSQADVFWANDEIVFRTGLENISEEPLTDAKGVVHTVVTKKQLYTDERNERRIVGIIRDVTERKRLEEQLRQAQKMESIGLLAGGIAHDFNNLMTPILGGAELLLRDPNQDGRARLMREIKQAAERASELTRQLLAFGRKQMLELKTIDLGDVITRFEPMLRRTIRESIRLDVVLSPSVGSVRADVGQIEQVLLNLAINARDAIANEGVITIEAHDVELDASYGAHHPEAKPGPHVMIAVSDTGGGMDRETQERLFEPFFSTKDRSKGSGLGLSMVYGIVKQHGGSISVYSELGKGSVFKIYLPRRAGGAERTVRSQPPTRSDAPPGGETILVVEDDDMVRSTACEMLRRLGYRVLTADGPEDCYRVVEGHDGTIDLLLTDVILAKSNGKEVYGKLRALRPRLRVLYMSGYTSNVIVHQGAVDEGVHFIQNPLALSILSSKVREVLEVA